MELMTAMNRTTLGNNIDATTKYYFIMTSNDSLPPKDTFSTKLCSNKVNDAFVGLTVSLAILSGLATILNALLIRFLFKIRNFHPNVHLLLKNLAVAVFLSSLFMFVRLTSYHAFLIILGFQRMKIETTLCSLIEIPFTACFITLIMSIVGIGFERLVATIKGKLDSDRAGIGTKTITVTTWLVGFGNCLCFYAYAFVYPRPICYCQISTIPPHKALNINVLLYVCLEVTVVFVYWYVYHRNCTDYADFTINTARHNLHERFQMLNNVQTTRMLLPVVIVHALFFTIFLSTITFVRSIYDESDLTHINLLLITFHLIVVEMIIQPILIIRRNEHLKKIAHELCPFLGIFWGKNANCDSDKNECTIAETAVIDYRMKPETHQDILDQIWSAKPMLNPNSKKLSVRKLDVAQSGI